MISLYVHSQNVYQRTRADTTPCLNDFFIFDFYCHLTGYEKQLLQGPCIIVFYILWERFFLLGGGCLSLQLTLWNSNDYYNTCTGQVERAGRVLLIEGKGKLHNLPKVPCKHKIQKYLTTDSFFFVMSQINKNRILHVYVELLALY